LTMLFQVLAVNKLIYMITNGIAVDTKQFGKLYNRQLSMDLNSVKNICRYF
jgi:hypothetical protein